MVGASITAADTTYAALIAELLSAANLSTLAPNNADRMRRAAAALSDADRELAKSKRQRSNNFNWGVRLNVKLTEQAATLDAVRGQVRAMIDSLDDGATVEDVGRVLTDGLRLILSRADTAATVKTEALNDGCVACGLADHDVTGHDANVRARHAVALSTETAPKDAGQ